MSYMNGILEMTLSIGKRCVETEKALNIGRDSAEVLVLETIKGFRGIGQVTVMLQSSWWNSGFLLLHFLLSAGEGRNGKCLGDKDHCCDTSQTQWSVAGIRQEKQEQGTQLTHSSKAAAGGGRENLEEERDGFGKLPTVKPFPPAQLLQIKISANEKKSPGKCNPFRSS